MNSDHIMFSLKKIGLTDAEAAAYLASLDLGASSVQKIAQRAGLPRATTYLVLDDLKQKGFVTSFQQGKKTLFSPESPEQLHHFISIRAEEVNEQKKLADSLVQELLSRGQFGKQSARPTIRFYEGPEALRALIRDNIKGAKGELVGILSHDQAEALLKKAGFSWDDIVKRRKRSGVKRRQIYTYKNEKPEANRVAKGAIYIPYDEFPCSADVQIGDDRVAFVPYDEPIRGVAIEDRAIADTMRTIFNALWKKFK